MIVLIGEGLDVSDAVARRFAAAGYPVGLLGADRAALDALVDELAPHASSVLVEVVDITDSGAAVTEIECMVRWWDRIDVLHVDLSAWRQQPPLHATLAQAARGFMSASSRVTFTRSMGADNPPRQGASGKPAAVAWFADSTPRSRRTGFARCAGDTGTRRGRHAGPSGRGHL